MWKQQNLWTQFHTPLAMTPPLRDSEGQQRLEHVAEQDNQLWQVRVPQNTEFFFLKSVFVSDIPKWHCVRYVIC